MFQTLRTFGVRDFTQLSCHDSHMEDGVVDFQPDPFDKSGYFGGPGASFGNPDATAPGYGETIGNYKSAWADHLVLNFCG